MIKSEDHLCHVESSHIFTEELLHLEMMEKLTTLSVFKDQVQLLAILESIVQIDNERMSVDRFENRTFSLGLLNKFLVYVDREPDFVFVLSLKEGLTKSWSSGTS
ncbi:hypothetical protein GJ744_001213 [Endocarpon pusillum]|uniref:Uncharacterized protein n=1 Tax=Endocarpon pusillum TaxID=364733 RepID=A0A8H7ADM4_9EURO|nr:hypothetical protein GJ744_001213 [Endocarpon pusillum]